MHLVIQSNSWPLRRTVCRLLLRIPALWAMSRTACAQLYIAPHRAAKIKLLLPNK